MKIVIEVSLGELIDKLTILEIKKQNIDDENKLINISREWSKLIAVIKTLPSLNGEMDHYFARLQTINQKLWSIEDRLREKECNGNFDEEFVELARAVYLTNDQRSAIKKEINIKYGSEIVEEKCYQAY